MNESIIYNLIIVVHGIKFTLEIISVYYNGSYKRDFFNYLFQRHPFLIPITLNTPIFYFEH